MPKYLLMSLLAALAACTQVPQATPRAPVQIGTTETGKPIYEFQITRSNALGITPIPASAIAARALEICPGGYQELRRTGEVTRRISGVFYTDVTSTIACG